MSGIYIYGGQISAISFFEFRRIEGVSVFTLREGELIVLHILLSPATNRILTATISLAELRPKLGFYQG